MITRENLKFCFDNLTHKEIEEVFNSKCDYIAFELHIFNSGGYSTIKPLYAGECWTDITDGGNLVLDVDEFLQLFQESDSVNPYLIELL